MMYVKHCLNKGNPFPKPKYVLLTNSEKYYEGMLKNELELTSSEKELETELLKINIFYSNCAIVCTFCIMGQQVNFTSKCDTNVRRKAKAKVFKKAAKKVSEIRPETK